MRSYKEGDEVKVIGNSYYGNGTEGDLQLRMYHREAQELVGKFCTVKDTDIDSGGGNISVWNPDKSDWWRFRDCDLKPAADSDKPQTTMVAW